MRKRVLEQLLHVLVRQPVVNVSPLFTAAHQSRAAQNTKLVAYSRLADTKRRDDVVNANFAVSEQTEDFKTCFVCKTFEKRDRSLHECLIGQIFKRHPAGFGNSFDRFDFDSVSHAFSLPISRFSRCKPVKPSCLLELDPFQLSLCAFKAEGVMNCKAS